jgi:hypothetical protein
MELKYGFKKTYLYELDKERLKEIVSFTNRGEGQTQFLFQLVDGNFDELKRLEEIIKTKHIGYCPGDKQEVNTILYDK